MPGSRRLVLLAGPSGSGKTRLARRSGLPTVRLDDFYHDADHPGLPRTLGIVDWDDVASWNAAAAIEALDELLATGRTRTPEYSIPESRKVGDKELVLPEDATVVLAEGIFAVEALPLIRAAGLDASGIYLDRPGILVARYRLRRDLRQHRKSVWVLLRRGLALWRAQGALKRRALANGFDALSYSDAERRLTE
ncbi:MAG: uridine kinase [Micropruina sp.]|uniref:uridine kinase family protein n=1 Tax=Micropruina sp. TaxID=2737536 RepID=UPI0039E6F5FF